MAENRNIAKTPVNVVDGNAALSQNAVAPIVIRGYCSVDMGIVIPSVGDDVPYYRFGPIRVVPRNSESKPAFYQAGKSEAAPI